MILPLVLLAALWHPDSLSETLIEVRGSEALLTMRLQVLSLLEVIPELDADGDEQVTTEEIQAKKSEILGYVLEHYGVWTGTDRDMQGGTPLLPEPMRLQLCVHMCNAAHGGLQENELGHVAPTIRISL